MTNIYKSFTYKMAAKIYWHRHGTKLRHCHPICIDPVRHYASSGSNRSLAIIIVYIEQQFTAAKISTSSLTRFRKISLQTTASPIQAAACMGCIENQRVSIVTFGKSAPRTVARPGSVGYIHKKQVTKNFENVQTFFLSRVFVGGPLTSSASR